MPSFEESLLAQLSLTCSQARHAFAENVGMSQTRVQLLMLLSHGETSHASLQQRLVMDGATLTRQIKQFEIEGIVSRRLDPQDNRYTLVALTPSGQQIATGLLATYESFQALLLDGIAKEEQAATLSTLQKLREHIQRIQDE